MTQINNLEEMAEQVEVHLLQQRIAAKDAGVRATIHWVQFGAALGLSVMAAVFLLLKVESRRRQRSEDELRVYQNRLQDLVAARTRELRESEERLRVTLTSIGDAVLVCDAEGRITFLNPVAAALTGWPVVEAKGQPVQSVFKIINGETREPAADIIGCVLREKRIVALANHTELVTRDGRELPIEDSASPILDDAGRIAGVVVVFHDVTERRRADETMRATLKRFYDMLAAMYSGVLVMTQDGRIEFANQAFCDYYELREAPADLVGLASPDLLAKIKHAFRNPDQAAARIGEILERGQPIRSEEFLMQDGRAALRDFVPLTIGGKPSGRLWLLMDITARKQAEAALQESNDELTRFNQAAVGRELRMIELKEQVNELCIQLGQPPRYPLDSEPTPQ